MSISYQELLALARRDVPEIAAEALKTELERGTLVLIDCREPEEFATGVIPGAWKVPLASVQKSVLDAGLSPEADVVIYCAVGARSAVAGKLLQDVGFQKVRNLAGGIARWSNLGFPVVGEDGFTPEQRERYARHLVLPEVGVAGQEKLLASRVAVVGAGGLGSPVALYLAAAGVGTLVLVDFDVVDASNLQRQILHNHQRVGQPKVASARTTLEALNPDIRIVSHQTQLQASNVLELLEGCDLVVDGADNFPTRYLLNDASLHLRVPVVHGAIFRFEGQVSVFSPYRGPCYRCLFPTPPPPELTPNCAEAGVLGVLPGIIGSIQAMEALKILLDLGDTLQGRLLLYDALDQHFQTVSVKRNPACPACGDETSPPTLIDYDQYCRPVTAA